MSDIYVPIIFPLQRVLVPGTGVTVPLGHAGALYVNGQTGEARYVEFGRYQSFVGDPAQGVVRSIFVSSFDTSSPDKIAQSLTRAMNEIADGRPNYRGAGATIFATPFDVPDGSYEKISNFVDPKLGIPSGEYGAWTAWRSCYTFTKDIGSIAGIDIDRYDGLGPTFLPSTAALEIAASRGAIVRNADGTFRFVSGPSTNQFVNSIPPGCFTPTTPILMADGTEQPIGEIAAGDIVLGYAQDDPFGPLVPGKVVRVMRNTTYEWLELTYLDGGRLTLTPGHEVPGPDGHHHRADALVHWESANQGRITLIHASGALRPARVERVVYSAATAYLYEQVSTTALSSGYGVQGNLALKHADLGIQ